MDELSLELPQLFDYLIEKTKQWKAEEILTNVQKIGKITVEQLKSEKYSLGKFREDKNVVIRFFESMDRFSQTGLPMSLDHFTQLVNSSKKLIKPYPHYSGIVISVPK